VPNSRLPEILSRARCFVLPSPYEGQPKALLEAMACGLPCIAADIPAVAELSRNGTVVLFEAGSGDALAAALRRVLADDDLAGALGREARRVVEERFDLRELVQREAALLASVARAD
jgi:glycosyltransferase involved in cell wall biosynthesis